MSDRASLMVDVTVTAAALDIWVDMSDRTLVCVSFGWMYWHSQHVNHCDSVLNRMLPLVACCNLVSVTVTTAALNKGWTCQIAHWCSMVDATVMAAAHDIGGTCRIGRLSWSM